MPKAMQYTNGSIIYFDTDHDERIFILQSGTVIISSTDIETGQVVTEQVQPGGFFGVKSALGHVIRGETATALSPTIAVALTIQEFEVLFSNNKPLIMKMLRVFSNQLRQIHKKTQSILHDSVEDQQAGMIAVAKSFYDEEQYRSACDVYLKFLTRFPNSPSKNEAVKLYADSKLRSEKLAGKTSHLDIPEPTSGGTNSAALKVFSLPAFERFSKKYEPGQVIIAEYEPGDTFYLIQSGQIQLVKCVNGSKKNLDILKPGEFFGEMAILDNSPRSATCMAIGNVECLEFNKENFEVLITGNPQIALILLKMFCKRIYDQKRRFRILAIKDITAKIADVFLMLDEMNPVSNPNERTRKFNVTVGDVAHWAGLSLDATREEINKFVERRRIEVFDNYIIVSNILDMKRTYDTRANIGTR